MKAIRTRYFGPGNVRGSRIKASDMDGNARIVGYDHALDSEGNHYAAAVALCEEMGWGGALIGGALAPGEMAWVFVPERKASAA